MIADLNKIFSRTRKLACPIAATALAMFIVGPANASAAHLYMRSSDQIPSTGLPNPTVGSLGFSDAIAGDVAIVGEPGVNDGTGAVVMYHRSGQSWSQTATFNDPRNQTLDEYGWSVAITSSSAGTYAAVGASSGNANYNIVYVYVLANGKWSQQAMLPDPGGSGSDNFGDSVAISANKLIVGSPCVDNENGRAFVYLRFNQSWTLEASIPNPLSTPKTWFGQSVSISGSNIMIGAVDKAYIYTENAKRHWLRTKSFTNPGSAKDNFGWDVALSGTTAAVGAPGGVPNTVVASPLSAGSTYVFTLRHGKWSLQSKISSPSHIKGNQFGYSISLAGDSLLIGMPLSGKIKCGSAYEYRRSGTKWQSQAPIPDKQCNGSGGSQFGFAVAQSGNQGVFGAPYCNSLKGNVYLMKVP